VHEWTPITVLGKDLYDFGKLEWVSYPQKECGYCRMTPFALCLLLYKVKPQQLIMWAIECFLIKTPILSLFYLQTNRSRRRSFAFLFFCSYPIFFPFPNFLMSTQTRCKTRQTRLYLTTHLGYNLEISFFRFLFTPIILYI
jgi:hypothetical protein